MRTNPKRNRLLSIFLSVAMVLSMLPTGALRAYAEELAADEPAVAAPAEVGEGAEPEAEAEAEAEAEEALATEAEAEPEEVLATEAEAEPEEVLATEAEEQQAEPQLTEQTLTAKVGEGEDALEVKAEGMMPEGAELRVVEVPVEKVDAITEGETFLALDIAVVVAGEVWQPEEHGSELKVTVEKPEAIAEEARVEVMHVKADVTDEEGALDEQAVEALPEAVEAEEVETEAVETDGEAADGEVAFEAGSFSLYLFYTVEFSYDGYQYVLQGGGSVALSEVLAALGIAVDAADVASVEFSDPGLVSVEQAEGDWTLASLQAFDTEETLTVTLANGDSYEIVVTDSKASGSCTLQVTAAGNDVVDGTDIDGAVFELHPKYSISLTAVLAMPQQAGEKTVTFHVPAGWAIVGYSRLESDEDTTQTSASGAFCGYRETVGAYVEIDGQYKDNIEKTALSTLADEETRYGTLVTPEDGKWGTQYLEGYGTGRGSVYGGDVTYTFKPNAANAKLVVTLRPQARLFPHISSEYTEEMPPVTVTTSCTIGGNAETLTSEMNVVVTDIPKASLNTNNPEYNVVSYTPDTRSGMIVIGANDSLFFANDSEYWASQTNVDEWEYTITYPAGVFIARDSDGNLITKSTDPAATMRSWGEYEINEDETQGGGTITMRGTYGSMSHSSTGFSRFAFMFYAKTGEGDDFEPNCTTYHESDSQVVITGSGWIKRCGETLDLNNTWKSNIKVFDEGDGSLYIKLFDRTDTRRDLTGDFGHEDYSWYLANMPYSTKYTYDDVRFRFVNNIAEDGSYLGVNGFTLPGRHLHDIVVTTTKGRTVTLYENGQYASTGYHQTNNYCRESGAYRVTREMLGLDIDEFILTAECTLDIKQGTYVENYLTSGIGVIGRNIDGKGGTVTVSVIDDDGNVVINPETEKPIQATLTNVPGQTVIGAGNCSSVVTRSPYTTDVNEYTPNDYIQFSSAYHAGSVMSGISQDTIIDPTITIALPQGVKLNENSVEGRSPAGNHGDEWFTLERVGYREVEDENGVVWQCYDYKSPNVLDLVAVESNTNAEDTTQAETWMYVRFGATVGPTCPQYSLNTDEIILWYLGSGKISSATQNTSYIVMDGTKTGHTANGEPVSADNPAVPTKVVAPSNDFLIKDLVGLGVDLSIRPVEDPEEDWTTYNGGDSSAAIVHEGKNAEVKLNYFSTSKSDFFKETELFIEIPHEGVSLKYVNNANIENPIDEEVIKTPEFTMALTGPVTMVDDDGDDYVTTWKTYYATAATSNSKTYEEAVEEGTEVADAWTPFTDVEWKTADQLTEADYKDVVLVKFVADNDIAPEGTGSVIMNLEVADDAELDQFDYWRAYARERLGDHARDWRYTPVIAATPSSATLSGLLFVDEDDDADFDEEIEEAFTEGTVTATIKGGNNYLGGEALTINSDGSIDLVDDEGRTIYLRKGDYTITFTMDAEDSKYFFERIDSATPSTVDTDEARTVDWYNDIKTANVSGTTATYKFTVDKSMVPKNRAGDYVPAIYPVGVGLSDVKVTAEKVWDDEDDQDGIRPASVTIELLANGEPAGMSVTLNGEVDDYGETEPWVATFDGLDAIKDGDLVTYTVDETVEGVITDTDGPGTYAFEVEAVEGEENSFTVTNTHTPELRDITATKAWSDADDQDGCRPDSVTLKLMNGTTEVGSVTLDGTPDENGETAAWTATWEDLDKYEGGTEISYTVTEVTTGTITGTDGPQTYKFEVTGDMDGGFTVTNTHTPEKVDVRGVKIWDDAKYFENGTAIADYERPESVKITLRADGTATDKTVTVDGTADEAGEYEAWKYEFTRLDKYKAGTVITYSIVEDVPAGYAATYVNNYDVKNTPNEGEELNPTQLVVKKVDAETTTGTGLKGAEFKLTKPDGTTETYTTNDNGTVTIPLTVATTRSRRPRPPRAMSSTPPTSSRSTSTGSSSRSPSRRASGRGSTT